MGDGTGHREGGAEATETPGTEAGRLEVKQPLKQTWALWADRLPRDVPKLRGAGGGTLCPQKVADSHQRSQRDRQQETGLPLP